jgi:predicted amidophosphoribosyltransferase
MARLIPAMLPIPSIQPGVCQSCRGGIDPTNELCWQCNQARSVFGDLPDLLPIALTTADNPLYEALRSYKNHSLPSNVQLRHQRMAAAVLTEFTMSHRECIGPFDAVANVPSQTREAVKGLIDHCSQLSSVYEPTLAPNRSWSGRDMTLDRYSTTRSVEGERILLVDDTFVSGASIFSAVHALISAGATVVGPIAIGRHMKPEWRPSARILTALQSVPWRRDRCARCSPDMPLDLSSPQLF